MTCNVTLLGGGFGRKSKPDYVAEAAILSKQLGKPVKVVWSREDDIRFDFYHAVAAMYIKAATDEKGRPTAWLQRSVFPPIGSQDDVGAKYGTFELDMVQLSGSALFGDITNGSTVDKGTVRGTQSDAQHAQLTLKQPGLNRTGTINITIISDGNSFIASGTLSNGQTFTWQGTKKHPVSH